MECSPPKRKKKIKNVSRSCSLQRMLNYVNVLLLVYFMSVAGGNICRIDLIYDKLGFGLSAETVTSNILRLTASHFDHPCVWSVLASIHSIQHINYQQPSPHNPSNKQTLHSEYQKHSRKKEERRTMRYRSVFSLISDE